MQRNNLHLPNHPKPLLNEGGELHKKKSPPILGGVDEGHGGK